MKNPQRLAWLLLAGWGQLGWGQTPGQALFETHCSACHQTDGSGTVGLAPALKGEHWQKLGPHRPYVLTVLTQGLAGRIEVNGQVFIGNMPSFAATLDDTSLALVATQVLLLQGAPQPVTPYTREEVAAARSLKGSPPQTRQLRQSLLSTP